MPIARLLRSSVRVLGLCGLLLAMAGAAADEGPALTPLGAERNGNADGSIPAWAGDNQGPANRGNPAQFVTRANAEAYAALLSPGQQALLQALPETFRMPVYGSRRGYAPPAAFAETTVAGIGRARVLDDGGITAHGLGLPFPLLGDLSDPNLRSNANAGLAAIWNHRLRWRGPGRERRYQQASISAEGVITELSIREDSRFLRGQSGDFSDNGGPLLTQQLVGITAPPYLAGSLKLVHEGLRPPLRAWQRSPIPGERNEAFAATSEAGGDTYQIGSDGQYSEDQREGFAGDPSGWRWNLLGKRELLVPYHADNLHARGRTIASVLGPRHPDPVLLRYERHRVWQLEARLKPDSIGAWPRRVFYLDEDSWQVLLVEHYGANEQLQRVQEVHVRLAGDVLLPAVEIVYDLPRRRYFVTGLETAADATALRAQDGDKYEPGNARRWAKSVGAVPVK